MFKVTFSRAGRLDLHELVIFIGKENPQAAAQVSKRIFEKTNLLETQPWIGRPGKLESSRELVVDGTPYIVVYRVNTDRRRVFILRIVHHAQRWPEKL